MSDPEKPKFNPAATIQIELDQVQLVDPDAVAPSADGAKSRRTPPPLPPGTAMPEVMASAATPARARSSTPAQQTAQKDARLALHLAVIVGVVVIAVAAGLLVASRMRSGSPPAASASSSAVPAPGAPSASAASSAVLEIPPIEVR